MSFPNFQATFAFLSFHDHFFLDILSLHQPLPTLYNYVLVFIIRRKKKKKTLLDFWDSLKVCVLPKSMLRINPQCNGIWRWGLWKVVMVEP